MTARMISQIYQGPVQPRATYTKTAAKRAVGPRSKVWRCGKLDKASDNVPAAKIRVVDKYVDVHTPQGVMRGVNIQHGEHGDYFILGHHEYKVVPIGYEQVKINGKDTVTGAGVYRLKGVELDQCKILHFHPSSPIRGLL